MFKSRELLDYLGIISTIFLGLVVIYCILIDPEFNLTANVFSDLGWHQSTALLFNGALIIKGLLDCIFVWHATRELGIKDWRIKILLYLPVVTFALIGVVPKFPLRPIHWAIAFISFFSWMLSQYIYARHAKSKAFMEHTQFILLMEVVFIIAISQVRLFWGVGEMIIMALLVTWLLKFQKILFKF